MDSSEEDEDYIPGVDPNEPDDDENDIAGANDDDAAPLTLSITKQKAVDDAFFDLFGYHFVAPPTKSIDTAKSENILPTKSHKHTFNSKRHQIISSIFGRRTASKLAIHAKRVASLSKSKPCLQGGGLLRLEKRTVVEIKRFAGQEIKVEKVVMVPVMAGEDGTETADGRPTVGAADATSATANSTTTNSTTTNSKEKGVDNLLTELSRPEKLSTVAKTSADWDLFKSKNTNTELKEKLEDAAKGKEAYLVKQDFLSRVDQRKFELERRDRDRERARRGK
eukprot:CAMPEP_0183740116 /NCGR_PEP_ID=MMETSP0737-20130205/58785_1 /TAXON_ID=385413 /ORGANISM="Thalassiosira miniscula, Strain CCMP1093" /LENGTH=279 /DNA_ID=CAMNT_0025975101 /DNA_START=75 /DNA_END=914 /DNA_ORIENTATION=+